MKILVVNGPNLNLLGKRDQSKYGQKTLKEMNQLITDTFPTVELEFFQSNHEGAILDCLNKYQAYDGIVINPGALTHYSYALRDCIEVINKPVVEVHMSNVYNREGFRKESVISAVCTGKISGFKEESYILAIEYIKRKWRK